jgi:hypothetical protein
MTKKLLEDKVKENLDVLGFDDEFSYTITKACSLKEKISKLDFIKITTF